MEENKNDIDDSYNISEFQENNKNQKLNNFDSGRYF